MNCKRLVTFLCCALLSGCATWGDDDSLFEDDGRYEHLKSKERKKQEEKDARAELIGDAILAGALVTVVGGLVAIAGAKEERAARKSARKLQKEKKKNTPRGTVTVEKILPPSQASRKMEN